MSAVRDPAAFPFVPALQAAFGCVLAELRALAPGDFAASPDSLTTIADGYDETGWLWFPLFGGGATAANRTRCPATTAACAAVPGLVNAGFSLFRAGTRLYPHRGEMQGVLRCHLPLLVPEGDVALRIDGEVVRWQTGRCVIFDDTVEHEAWNRGATDRVVLLLTFQRTDPGGSARGRTPTLRNPVLPLAGHGPRGDHPRMASSNDTAFHLRMAFLVILSMFGEHLAGTHLPNWSSPRIGVITFVLGLLWVGLFSWQLGKDLQGRNAVLDDKLDRLGARLDQLEDDRRARRSLPPM